MSDRGDARVVLPDRSQLSWDLVDLEAWLPADHRARVVWAFVERLDLSALYERIAARAGEPGRPAADPRVLLALWLLATIEGVGSARALDPLAKQHLAYRWLAGGVPVNYHGLADFRVEQAEVLDELMTRSLAALMAEGLVELDELTVDGTKVRASAGRGTYRRRDRLAAYESAVRDRLARLRDEVDSDPAATSRRRQAARARAERERGQRIEKARRALDKADAERAARLRRSPGEKTTQDKSPPESSSSDPEARKMRFADGSVAPGYNVQVVTDPNGLIVAIAATDRRADHGLAGVMVEAVHRRLGRRPRRLLADTGYARAADIVALSDLPEPVTVYMPPPADNPAALPVSVRKREQRRAREPLPLQAWRQRMATPEGRAAVARRNRIERVNAQLKRRGLAHMLVRGLQKVQAVALLHALAHNLMLAHRLRAT